MDKDSPSLLMIDAETARDRDDAISVTRLPDGDGWSLEIHVAGVADVVTHGSIADEQAFLRGGTRYLPTRTIPMLGEEAESAATLTADADRTTLQVTAVVDRDGALHDVSVSRARIAAGRCVALNHGQVPSILADQSHPLHQDVAAADEAAQVLLNARRASGALAIYDLAAGWATDEDGSLVRIEAPNRTSAYVIVQEMMIAANEAVAMWCIEAGLPILFRNHRMNPVAGSAEDLMHEYVAASGDATLFDKLRSRMLAAVRPATYEPTVHGHHSLRLAAYTHVTSPLRRLADLVNQRMIFAYLDHDPVPYSGSQLTAIGTDLNRRARERRELKKNSFKSASKRIVARQAAGDLSVLDSGGFTKVLKSLRSQPLSEDLAIELKRRSSTDQLSVADIAFLIDAVDPSWRASQLDVVDQMSLTHPEMAPSAAAAWRQIDPERPASIVEFEQHGPSHDRSFAARATHLGWQGPWVVAKSKKAAEQGALWAAVRAQLAGVVVADSAPDWPVAAVSEAEAPVDSDYAPAQNPVAKRRPENEAAGSVVPIALGGAKKQKALSNPVAWLMTLAQKENVPAPEWVFDAQGPDHARQFVATVYFAGRTHTVASATKSKAKTRSATNLIEALFADCAE